VVVVVEDQPSPVLLPVELVLPVQRVDANAEHSSPVPITKSVPMTPPVVVQAASQRHVEEPVSIPIQMLLIVVTAIHHANQEMSVRLGFVRLQIHVLGRRM